MCDGDRLLFKEFLETFAQIDILSRADRRRAGILEPPELIGVEPWNYILVPGEIVLIQSSCEFDEGLDGHGAVMVRSDRHLPADNAAHGGHIVLHPIQCLLGEERRSEQ